jgi:hypothetical protein
MKKVSEQKNSRLGKSGEAPVHILVLTDKNAACCRSLSKLPIFLCDDRTGGEPDYTLLAFLPFLNAIPQQSPSGFVFSLVGDIHTNEDFLNAMGFAHNLRVDMVVWYSFAMAAQSEDMRDLVVHEAVEFAMANNCIVIYPFLSMPLLNSPGAIPVAGVRVEDSIFRLPRIPAQIVANKPKVVTLGNWTDFQRVWERSNLVISVPDQRRRMEGHGLAVWSVTAVAAWWLRAQKLKGVQNKTNDFDKFLRVLCVPVELQPDHTRVTYGYLDPRRVAEFGN